MSCIRWKKKYFLYRIVAACVGRKPKIVCKLWNLWVQDIPLNLSSWLTLRVKKTDILLPWFWQIAEPHQEIVVFAKWQIPARRIRRRLQQHEVLDRRLRIQYPWRSITCTPAYNNNVQQQWLDATRVFRRISILFTGSWQSYPFWLHRGKCVHALDIAVLAHYKDLFLGHFSINFSVVFS